MKVNFENSYAPHPGFEPIPGPSAQQAGVLPLDQSVALNKSINIAFTNGTF